MAFPSHQKSPNIAVGFLVLVAIWDVSPTYTESIKMQKRQPLVLLRLAQNPRDRNVCILNQPRLIKEGL